MSKVAGNKVGKWFVPNYEWLFIMEVQKHILDLGSIRIRSL